MSDSDWMTDEEFAASLAARSTTQISTSDFTSEPVVVTIKGFETFKDPDSKDPRPKWKMFVREFDRPFIPCVKMRRLIEAAWKKPRPEWMGRKMRLYLDPRVSYGKRKNIGGIRISGLSHWEGGTISVEAGRGTQETHQVASLDVARKPPTASAVADKLRTKGLLDAALETFGDNLDVWDVGKVIEWAQAQTGGGGA